MSAHVLGATTPLPDRKSPLVAGLFGISLGALGTAIYLRNWRDLVLLGVPAIVAGVAWPGGPGFWAGQMFCAAYGAARVFQGNARLDAMNRAEARRAAGAMRLRPVDQAAEIEPEQPEPVAEASAPDPSPVVTVEPEAPRHTRAPAPAELPAEENPPSPPASPAPAKRGRPKGSRKLAA